MNNAVNNKRVFLVMPHVPIGYLDIVGRRGDVRLDQLENGSPTNAAKSVLAAAHAYQTSSARDELARDLHTGVELLAHTPNLLLVSTNGAGYDTVDVRACTERGILVLNQAGGNAESVAEHVLGMMLALVKRVGECDRALRAGTLRDRNDFTGREAHGKTIGIIGIGNVGRRVAELCGGLFRMEVIAYDPYVDAEETRRRGARKVALDELLRAADFVSVNCPLTDETRGMIGAREYALMKPTAYFITTARGFIHDEAALEAAGARSRRHPRIHCCNSITSSSPPIPPASPAKRAPISAGSPPSRCSMRSTASRSPASSIRKSGRITPSASSARSALRRGGKNSADPDIVIRSSPRKRGPSGTLDSRIRGNEPKMPARRHCERSEAIQSGSARLLRRGACHRAGRFGRTRWLLAMTPDYPVYSTMCMPWPQRSMR